MRSAVQEITDFAIDVLDRMDGPHLPAEAVFAFLCPRLDSPGAVLQRTTWRTGETEIRPAGFTPADVPLLIGATHAMRFEHPLMVATAAGDLTPATALTAAGGWQSWHSSPARAFLADLRGWDQMISIPLRGGPAEVCAFAFARPGRDYDDRELTLATAVQPLLRAMDRHARVMGRWRQDDDGVPGALEAGARDAGLTGREVSVLLCLSEGLTAAAIAHRLGCSVRTVGKHTGNIYRKLGVSDRLTAVLVAQRRGILRAAVCGPDTGTGRAPPAPR
jgi:DNA-binding CsgD family transcriptional regulator